ncbi:MAG: CopG family transcriptional regulator [Nitrospirae bacterium]|nr:CopG family transcriptional regulator [Nitrospirota bacterium]
MQSQMIIRVDSNTKDKFQKIVRMEGKTGSEKIREMIKDYIACKDFAATVDRIWDKMTTEFKKRGITEGDIEKAVKAVRASKKK